MVDPQLCFPANENRNLHISVQCPSAVCMLGTRLALVLRAVLLHLDSRGSVLLHSLCPQMPPNALPSVLTEPFSTNERTEAKD